MALPAELQALLDQVDAAEAEARVLVNLWTDEQANWQPDEGRAWSVVQCFDHLVKTQALYAGRLMPELRLLREGAHGRFNGLAPGFFGRKFIQILEPPPGRRVKAPRQILPDSNIPVAVALDAYVRSHEPYREMVRIASGVDANRVTVRNPFVPLVRMKLSTVLLIMPAHDRRHLWQAAQVKNKPGFPR